MRSPETLSINENRALTKPEKQLINSKTIIPLRESA